MVPTSLIAATKHQIVAAQAIVEQHRVAFLICLVSFAVLFFPELSGYTMKPDDEHAAFRNDGAVWIRMGRWANWLIILITGRELNPYFSVLAFGAAITISFLVFCRAVRIVPKPFVLFSFALFAAFPTWHYLIEWKAFLLAFGCAVLFATFSGALFNSKHPCSKPLFILFSMLAASWYQSAVLVTITVATASFIAREEPMGVRKFLKFQIMLALWASLAVALHLTVWALLLKEFDLSPYRTADFLRTQTIVDSPSLVIAKTFEQALSSYGGTKAFEGISLAGILFVLGLVSFCTRLFDRTDPIRSSISTSLVLVALLGVPFSLTAC